jgi:hypothetical protein
VIYLAAAVIGAIVGFIAAALLAALGFRIVRHARRTS